MLFSYLMSQLPYTYGVVYERHLLHVIRMYQYLYTSAKILRYQLSDITKMFKSVE